MCVCPKNPHGLPVAKSRQLDLAYKSSLILFAMSFCFLNLTLFVSLKQLKEPKVDFSLTFTQDLEQLLNFIGVNSLGPRHVLANLKELYRTILSPEYTDT